MLTYCEVSTIACFDERCWSSIAPRGWPRDDRRVRPRPEALGMRLDPEFVAGFRSALRVLVAVSSDMSDCSCELTAPFSELLSRFFVFASSISLFHRRPHSASTTNCSSLEVALVKKNGIQ